MNNKKDQSYEGGDAGWISRRSSSIGVGNSLYIAQQTGNTKKLAEAIANEEDISAVKEFAKKVAG